MLYHLEITIDRNRDHVVKLFDNSENLKEWQTGLLSVEHLSGEKGEVGAKTKLDFMVGKRQIELIETIQENALPFIFTGKYEWSSGWNTLKNEFIELETGKTLWKTETEMHLFGFMKVIGFLMPSSFKKNSFKFMQNFKTFAENYGK